jgi:tRNA(adenine34) deaminase
MRDKRIDEEYMRMALEEAGNACRKGEVPVGAVLVRGDQILSANHNRCIELSDPTAHAEILALRNAGELLGNYRLIGTVMYVTTEPCPMCAFAMVHSRIERLVFGTREPKFGAVVSKFELLKSEGLNHHVEVEEGVLRDECSEALKGFFSRKRMEKRGHTQGRRPGEIAILR